MGHVRTSHMVRDLCIAEYQFKRGLANIIDALSVLLAVNVCVRKNHLGHFYLGTLISNVTSLSLGGA